MCVYVLKRVRSNYLFGTEQDSSGRYPSRKSVPLSILASSGVMAKCLITDLHVILNHNIYNVKKKLGENLV